MNITLFNFQRTFFTVDAALNSITGFYFCPGSAAASVSSMTNKKTP